MEEKVAKKAVATAESASTRSKKPIKTPKEKVLTKSKKDVGDAGDNLLELIDEAISNANALPRFVAKRTLVKGKVIKTDRSGVVVDVGAKSEGVVPVREVSRSELEELNPGDEVLVYVLADEDEGGRLLLSIKRTESLRRWIDLENAKKEETPVKCVVAEVNAGGVMVDIKGILGFIPSTQLDPSRVYKLMGDKSIDKETFAIELPVHLGKLVGEEMEAKVMEVDREQNRVILSEKLVGTSLSVKHRESTLSSAKVGDILEGIVTDVRPYGIFINAEGLDGLVHISEISWDKVDNTTDFFTAGDKVKVMLIGLDEEGRRVAYSIKRLQKDPWEAAVERYKVGEMVEGIVTKVAPYGAFVKLGEGLNGLIHISELSDDLVLDPKEVVEKDQKIKVMILSVSPEERHLGLSLRRAKKRTDEDKEPKAKKESVKATKKASKTKSTKEKKEKGKSVKSVKSAGKKDASAKKSAGKSVKKTEINLEIKKKK